MRRARTHRPAAGFTLLEVVVALAILSMALLAIFDLNAGAVANHAYTKRITVASLLAREKMTDLEQKLYDEGFPADDEEESGDFSREGWPNYKWRARILAPRTTGVSTDKLLSALFNVPIGGEGGDDSMTAIAAMFGGGGGKSGGSGAGAAAMAGPMAGLAQGQMTQFLDQISKMVREVHLTVTWRDGKDVETMDVVTHVVSTGPGSDRNGGAAAAGDALAAAAGQGGQYVNTRTGQPISGQPVPCNGQLCDPNSPGDPVMPVGQFSQSRDQMMFGGTHGSSPLTSPMLLGGKNKQ